MHFIPLKKEPSNYSKYTAFASFALLHVFFNSNSVSFVKGGRKNISCPRAQGTLATPLLSSTENIHRSVTNYGVTKILNLLSIALIKDISIVLLFH